MSEGLLRLASAVQTNCDISDAAYAQDMTLCNYLLAMREHFRWERRIPAGTEPGRSEVGMWIAEREARWEGLESRDFTPLPLAVGEADPFDVDAVNAEWLESGWAYGASIGRFGKPHFFLGCLVRREWREGVQILEIGREIARDLEATPASLADGTIVLRTEAFERWLWTSAEAWSHTRRPGPLQQALESYGYEADPAGAIAAMAREQRETLLLHELGEHRAGIALGLEWEALMARMPDKRVELTARAVRDLLADCLVTLPSLASRRDTASLHFFFATLSSLRKALSPTLPRAYEQVILAGDWELLAAQATSGAAHWLAAGKALASGAIPFPADPAEIALN